MVFIRGNNWYHLGGVRLTYGVSMGGWLLLGVSFWLITYGLLFLVDYFWLIAFGCLILLVEYFCLIVSGCMFLVRFFWRVTD